jgi:hypothetical protein
MIMGVNAINYNTPISRLQLACIPRTSLCEVLKARRNFEIKYVYSRVRYVSTPAKFESVF